LNLDSTSHDLASIISLAPERKKKNIRANATLVNQGPIQRADDVSSVTWTSYAIHASLY